jgi:hypothetical protein
MSNPVPSSNTLTTQELSELATLVKNVERAMTPVLRERAHLDEETKAGELLNSIKSHSDV